MRLNKIDVADDSKSVSVEWLVDGVSHRRAFTIYDEADFQLSVSDLNPKIYTCLSPQLPASEPTNESPNPVAPERIEVIFYDAPPVEFEIIREAKTIDILEWQAPVDTRPDWIKSAPLIDPNKPHEISASQAKIALVRAGLYDDVLALIDSLPRNNEVRVWWETAPTFKRNFPVLLQMAKNLNLSSENLDELFLEGSKIV